MTGLGSRDGILENTTPRNGDRDAPRRDERDVIEPLSALARLLARQSAQEQRASLSDNDENMNDGEGDQSRKPGPRPSS